MNRPIKPTSEMYPDVKEWLTAYCNWERDIEKYCDSSEIVIGKMYQAIFDADTFCGRGNNFRCMSDCENCSDYAISFIDLYRRLRKIKDE